MARIEWPRVALTESGLLVNRRFQIGAAARVIYLARCSPIQSTLFAGLGTQQREILSVLSLCDLCLDA